MLGEEVRLAAADGFRLATKTLPIALQAEGLESAIIPTHTVEVLEHLSRKTPREAAACRHPGATPDRQAKTGGHMDKHLLRIRFGKVTVTARLIQGNPPNYMALIPKETIAEVMVMAPDLERAVRSVLGIAKETSGIVRLSWTEKELMTVKSGTEDSRRDDRARESTTPGHVALNIRLRTGLSSGQVIAS